MTKIDARNTALVVLDLQKGMLGFPFTPHSAEDLVARSAALAKAVRSAGGKVILVNVGFAPDFADAPQQGVDSPAQGGAPGSDWFDFPAELSANGDVVITKRQWGAFYGTELELQLRRRGISTVILTGFATNLAVESTGRDAWERGFNVVFVEDATAAFADEYHEYPYRVTFPQIGRVRSTQEVLAALA